MSDGRIHGVHVWIGPPDVEAPERPIPGPLKWDLTSGVATDTPESLFNIGKDPADGSHPTSRVRRGPADARPQSHRDQGAVDDAQARARHDALHHLGRHRSPGRADRGRIRGAGTSGESGRRNRAADRPGDELAQCAGRPRGAGRLPGTANSRGPGAIRRASRARRFGQLDIVEVAGRAVPLLRLAGRRGRRSRRSSGRCAPHGFDDSKSSPAGRPHGCCGCGRTAAASRRYT